MFSIRIIHEIQLSDKIVELLERQDVLTRLENDLKVAMDLLEAAIKNQQKKEEN